MNTNETDRKFQNLFDELKRQDSANAPDFAKLARVKASPRATGAPAWAWVVTASLAVFIAAISFQRLHSPSHRFNDEVSKWASLSTWESPSDALLNVASVTTPTDTDPDTTLKPN